MEHILKICIFELKQSHLNINLHSGGPLILCPVEVVWSSDKDTPVCSDARPMADFHFAKEEDEQCERLVVHLVWEATSRGSRAFIIDSSSHVVG